MYCTAFFIITVGLILFFLFPGLTGFLLKSVKEAGTFLWIILLCLQSVHPIVFPLPQLARVSSVCTAAS